MPDFEISDINPQARRVPGGIWNEDVLPVAEWEIAEHRVVVPEDLQRILGCHTPVLRWARAKRERVIAEHSQSVEKRVIADPEMYLSTWLHAGPEPGKTNSWRVFFRVGNRWCVVVIGRDRNGSFNVVTIHSPSDRNYVPNMIAKGCYIARENGGSCRG